MKGEISASGKSSRRDLLKAFAGAAALPAAGLLAQTPARKRGRIDVHHHHRLPSTALGRGGEWTPEISLQAMEKYGIETALLSLTQQADQLYDPTETGRNLARAVNEYGARIGRDHPGKFGLLASLPLADPDASLKEIEYAYD